NLYRPRPRFPAAIGHFLWLILRQTPLVEIVVTGDEIFWREFYPIEPESRIKRIVQHRRLGANSGRQQSGSGKSKAENAQKFPPSQIVRFWGYCGIGKIPSV